MTALETLFPNNSPKLVMFDLDGTLVDSIPDLAAAIDHMLHHLDRTAAGEDKVRLWVGNGASTLVKRALADSMGTTDLDSIPDDIYEEGFRHFLIQYHKVNGNNSVLYPGVIEILNKLAADECILAIVTNKPGRFTEQLLDKLGIHFNYVISGDTLENKKPAPDQLVYCMQEANCSAAESVMIGDSKSDVMAARTAGVPVICVSYGYNHGESIHDTSPDAVIDSLIELL
ncbi:phosphoglycolate phosphatase [Alkalimarinus coralli]|uniref:phosphoglycolate phosphatase n=1 Tax=Alkalimarinus coralli TaxID=2935863 RepID=UPI00202B5AA8|nr:phosphoglycolate phosphatase [Alkalimarinus coralli]